jgi:hypothetical protein
MDALLSNVESSSQAALATQGLFELIQGSHPSRVSSPKSEEILYVVRQADNTLGDRPDIIEPKGLDRHTE